MIRFPSSWFASLALGLLVVGPPAALGVCALADIGPGGEARTSLFPAAVTLLDPFVWTCLRQSATVAAIASLATIAGGALAGRVVGEAGGASGTSARVALGLVAASPPYLIALGIAGWLDAAGWGRFGETDAAWWVWVAAATVPGIAIGALAHRRAIDAMGPSWREAAMLAGGSRFEPRWRLAWPLIRPAMARAAALAFTLTLADPGPPLLLGLRRNLGFQMVVAATGDAPFPALASLSLIAIATAAAWRAALRLWSGPDRAPIARRDRPRPIASWRRAIGTSAATIGFGGFALATMAGLGLAAGSGGGRRFAADPTFGGILVRSLAMGIGAAALMAMSDRLLARLEGMAGNAAASRFRKLARAIAPPPIVAGAVILAAGRLATLAAAEGWTNANMPSEWLDAERAPLMATTLAVWLALATSRVGRRPLDPAGTAAIGPRFDAAILAGSRRGAARRLARGARWGDGGRDFAATAAAAAVALAPAILIASSATIATVGPAIPIRHERGAAGAADAAVLATLAWAVALATAPIGAACRRIDSTPDPPLM